MNRMKSSSGESMIRREERMRAAKDAGKSRGRSRGGGKGLRMRNLFGMHWYAPTSFLSSLLAVFY